jgi:hypothetical protein
MHCGQQNKMQPLEQCEQQQQVPAHQHQRQASSAVSASDKYKRLTSWKSIQKL